MTAPTPIDAACALASHNGGFASRPYTFERFEELSADLGPAERLELFFGLPAHVQDWLWADLAERLRSEVGGE
jgi:hypothetical protein